jgi:uncharacterized membrane protein
MFNDVIETIGKALEFAGVASIVIGAVVAAVRAVLRLIRRDASAYVQFRRSFGRSILLGLELLVAADIIRTVALTPTLESVAVLGGIVLIRTFLSFSLELEITGKWPWQGSSEKQQAPTPPASAQPSN